MGENNTPYIYASRMRLQREARGVNLSEKWEKIDGQHVQETR